MHWLVASIFIVNISISMSSSRSDENIIDDNEYLENYTTESFFNSGIAEQTIDINNIDVDLLNATLFFYFDKKRIKGRRPSFSPNTELNLACKNIIKKYSGRTLRRYKKKKLKFNKIVSKRVKEAMFDGTYTEGFTDYVSLIDYKESKKYIYENGDFFYVKNKKQKKINPSLDPIPKHTYLSFAESIRKRQSFFGFNSQLRSKHFSQAGCFISITQKNKKKIPYAKVVWILGGYRLDLIESL